MSHTYRAYLDPHDAAEYRDMLTARDRAINALHQASDHRRVALLATQINATLADEHLADCVLTLAALLGDWLRTMPLNDQLTAISVITHLITVEITGQEGPPP